MRDPSESISDDVLIAGIAAGAAASLTALFRRRQGDVYRFALHMSGAAAIAEDVTQDVFLIVMRDAAKYQPGRSTVTAWLCGIARNCVRQRIDRDGRWESLDESDGDVQEQLPAADADPLAELTRAEHLELLRRAVLALPVRYREAVVLCDLEELSYAEAADALDCAIGTVRSRLHRARAMLAARVAAMQRRPAGVPGERPATGSPAVVTHKRCMA
jgi:RNA polymerase sigma-70 factor, ECF subfamily